MPVAPDDVAPTTQSAANSEQGLVQSWRLTRTIVATLSARSAATIRPSAAEAMARSCANQFAEQLGKWRKTAENAATSLAHGIPQNSY
jgi:hypothetical protein